MSAEQPSPTVGADAPRTVPGFYRRALRRHRRLMTASTVLVLLWQTCEAIVPIAIGLVIDDAVATGDGWAMTAWALGLCVLFTVLANGYRYGSRTSFTAMQREAHQLRGEVVGRFTDRRGVAERRLPGEVVSLASSDADVASTVLQVVPFAISGAVTLVFSAVYLLQLDAVIGLVVLLGVPTVLLLTQVLAPRLSRHAGEQQERISRASGVASDLMTGVRVLKGVGGERRAMTHYTRVSREAAGAGVQAAQSGGLLAGATTLLSGGLLAVVALLAAQRALDGDLTIGEFIAIVGLTQFIAEPMRILADVAITMATAVGSARRIITALHLPVAVEDGSISALPDGGALEVQDVVRVERGEFVGLVFDEQSAGDALIDVLSAAVPNRGRASLAGLDLDDLTLDVRREAMLVAGHRVDVFEGTVRSNIVTRTDEQAGEPDWQTVLEASALAEFIESEQGLDRPVSAGGGTLSGGQRQRLALARALAARPRLLVLQDPTTAVDAVTEHQIGQALRGALGAQSGVLLLSSSPALLAAADRVVHVSEDGVVTDGTHDSLVETSAAYREAVLR